MKKKTLKKPRIRFDVITLFPEMFSGPLSESLIGRAKKAKVIEINLHALRKWSTDSRHQKIDDRPFGGGAGMVIQVEPVFQAIRFVLKSRIPKKKRRVILMSPQGTPLTQEKVKALSKFSQLVLVCGHYEGIDERIMPSIDEEISIGDYVLTGGEIPAMAVIDSVSRFIPGVVGDPDSIEAESFSTGELDYPHYTRPSVWRGKPVPSVLLSGNHAEIKKWRREKAAEATRKKRPDLVTK